MENELLDGRVGGQTDGEPLPGQKARGCHKRDRLFRRDCGNREQEELESVGAGGPVVRASPSSCKEPLWAWKPRMGQSVHSATESVPQPRRTSEANTTGFPLALSHPPEGQCPLAL